MMFFSTWCSGFKYHKKHYPCPVPSIDTVFVHDTTWHTIKDTIPFYDVHLDTVIYDSIQYFNIDTGKVLRDYYAMYLYNRNWKNDTLEVSIRDFITQNKSVHSVFKYKINIPFTTIINTTDNTITYNSYLTGGISIPFKDVNYMSIDARLTMPKLYIGVGYIPKVGGIQASLGTTIIKFKKKK